MLQSVSTTSFIACALASHVLGQSGRPLFPGEQRPLALNSVHDIKAADVNGDGTVDLVAAYNGIAVLLGNGDGRFRPAVTYASNVSATPIVLGDLDEDGDLDIAARGYNSAVVLFNDGSGGFLTSASFAVGTLPYGIAIGDLNGDGNLDMATANNGSGNISVLRGDGHGGFTPAVNYFVGFGLVSIAIADVNVNGRQDVIVGVQASSSTVRVLYGTPTGGLTAPYGYVVGCCLETMHVADLNDDGKPDIATANISWVGQVNVALGDGIGFGSPSSFNVGNSPSAVTSGDFNGDGRVDLSVANYASEGVSVLLADGHGSFAAATTFVTGGYPNAIAAADFDGDCALDVATGNAYSFSASVLFGDGLGALEAPRTPPVGANTTRMLGADFDRDGLTDVVVGQQNGSGSPFTLAVRLATGAANFGPPLQLASIPWSASFAVLDVDADGNEDIACARASPGDIVVWRGDGAGGFVFTGPSSLGLGPAEIGVGDFNGDGWLDLAVLQCCPDRVGIVLNDGTGGFGLPRNFTTVGYQSFGLAIGDVNGDSNLDLATTSYYSAGSASVVLGDGKGGLSAAMNFPIAPWSHGAAFIDADRDGVLDLATTHNFPRAVAIRRGDGTGHFGSSVDYQLQTYGSGLTVADLNRDGILDLATPLYANAVAVLLGDGEGGFDVEQFGADTRYSILVVGEFNDDGWPDVAVSNYYSDSLSILLNQLGCPTVVSYCTPSTTTSGCNPTLSANASAASLGAGPGSFVLTCSRVEGQQAGVVFYGLDCATAVPFAVGSTSVLCVKAPVQRSSRLPTSGTLGQCDGAFVLDFFAFAAAHPSALGRPLTVGQRFHAQAWFSDPPAPRGGNLSDAIQFDLCP